MAGKRRTRKTAKGLVGPRGPRGKTGPAGARGAPGATGAPGAPANGRFKQLAAQVEQIVKELQTQLMRIGQIQAQLDRLAVGQAPEPRNRRRADRVEH